MAMLTRVREQVLPAVTREEPIQAMIVDDTSHVKNGKHSVGVARQYCGERGKQDNCQVAVSLSVATHQASLPVAYQLYLPQEWADDAWRMPPTNSPRRSGADEPAPTKYWLSTLPDDVSFKRLVDLTKLRWRIERDYLELKQEIGLDHYEGRGWRGFHHHASLCIAAYGFLISETETLPPLRRCPSQAPHAICPSRR
jgi:SRSO17 transposase